jgi:hypothetical protein
MRTSLLKINTHAILGDRELWVGAQLGTQVFYYNGSEEEDWNYVVR